VKDLLKKFGNNKMLVTIIAAILCAGILAYAYSARIKQKTNPVTIYYAKDDILARTEITEDMIGSKQIPASMVTSNVIRDYDNILGKYVNYNTLIPAGSFFYNTVLVDWDNMPDSAWSNIPEGNTIVSLAVNVNTTFGNSIFPGNKIDLYYKSYDSNSKLILGKLIEGIEVLAVKDDTGKHIFKKSPDQRQAAALIFSVSEEMHLLLRKAMYLDGDIIPVPRNANYNEPTNISSKYLESFILSQTVDVPLDQINNNDILEEENKDETNTNVNNDVNNNVNENENKTE